MLTAPDSRVLSMIRLATFGLVLVMAFPWRTFDSWSLVTAFMWAITAAFLVTFALQQQLLMTVTVMTGFVLAYSQGLGDALADGIVIAGSGARPEWILWALGGLALFLGVMLISASAMRRGFTRFVRVPDPLGQRARTALDIAILAFVFATLVAALATDSWSFWGTGGEGGAAPASGGIRLELAYPSALIALVGHAVVTSDGLGLFGRRRYVRYGVGALAFALLFLLQSRRLMIAAGLIVAIQWLLTTDLRRMSRVWLAARLASLVAVVAVLALASLGWREATREDTVDVGERIGRAFGSLGSDEGFESFESRLTYLWFDAITYELHDDQGADLDVADLFVSGVVRAIPSVLLSTKDDTAEVRCETATDGYGLPEDMPCTPTSEGFLVAGLWGVILAGILWGAFLGLGDLAVARGPGLVNVFAWLALMPLLVLESGLFAFVGALRGGVIGLLFVVVVYRVTDFILAASAGRTRAFGPRT